MSGIKDRYRTTLVSGYGLMGLQIVLTLATVPLALKYLGKEGFGIWALATQVAFWLQMLDAGMNGALARYLIDFKNDTTGDNLRNCLATGFRFFCVQGVVILVVTIFLSRRAGPAFDLDAVQSTEFGNVLIILGAITCLAFVVKPLQAWFYATQRLDICNNIALVGNIGEFGIFWLLLHAGSGIYALVWGRAFSAVISTLLLWLAAVKIGKFPVSYLWGAWNGAMFRKLVSFGGGMFILTLSIQLFSMTQTAMVTKSLGLTAAAVWAAAPKLFQVMQQMVSRLWDYRIPHLSSLMAGNHTAMLTSNFNGLFRATAYLGGGGLGAMIAMNPMFLNVWTHGAIQWSQTNDMLIGLAFYFALLIRCITDFVLHTKKIGWMPVLMLCEGVVFVVAAMLLLPHYGIPGMLLASLGTGGMLRLPYAWRHFSRYLSLDSSEARRLALDTAGGMVLGLAIFLVLMLVQDRLQAQTLWVSLLCQGFLAALALGPLALKLVIVPQAPQRV
jgi:O-antigen/teichoic acid export membrane protein